MALKLVSTKVVPVTLELAKKFRDMAHIKGERDLSTPRAKGHVRLIEDRKFFTALWGSCLFEGKVYRGNGNHTSHVITACMQAHRDGLDAESQHFAAVHLFVRGGRWAGESPADLPAVSDKDFKACVEEFTAETREDLTDFFRRYDAKESTREQKHLLRIWVGEHDDLDGLDAERVGKAVAGIIRAARERSEAFGFEAGGVPSAQGDGKAIAMKSAEIRRCARWMVETVPDAHLYAKPAGAQIFAEVWAEHGEAQATRVVEEVMEQLDDDDSLVSAWYIAMTTPQRKKSTPEALVKKGRNAVAPIVESLMVTN